MRKKDILPGGLDEARRVYVMYNTICNPPGSWTEYETIDSEGTAKHLFSSSNLHVVGRHDTNYVTDYFQSGSFVRHTRPSNSYRFYEWKPDRMFPCCLPVNTYSLLNHCKSASHIAKIYGVRVSDVKQANSAIKLFKELNKK